MIAASALLAGLVGARTAGAETEADRLFREGRSDLDRGDYDSACEKFERSYAVDPEHAGGGVVGNLADCEEHFEHFAKAWRLWNDAELRWRRAGIPQKARFAQDRATVVAEKATTVVIGVSDPTAPGLAITVNGERVAPAKTIRTVVDPGAVDVSATASGAAPFHRARTAAAGETVVVEIRLASSGTAVITERRKSRVQLAWLLGGTASASALAGLSFALVGKRRYDAAVTNDCGGDIDNCSDTGVTRVNAARRLADVGTGFGVAAFVVAASAVAVYFTAPRDVVIAPTVSGGTLGLAVGVRF